MNPVLSWDFYWTGTTSSFVLGYSVCKSLITSSLADLGAFPSSKMNSSSASPT